MKTALLIGATGLVGSNLTRLLLENDSFGSVTVFVRRSMGIRNPKLTEYLIDFDLPESWKHLVKGDVLFSCLGTTLGKAGSKEAQRRVDYTYQWRFAETAAENGVRSYVLISSAGADPKSRAFYLGMKGDLEEDIKKLNFQRIAIIRPGLLQGEREESRFKEEAGEFILGFFNRIGFFRKYRPIPAEAVARAMVRVLNSNERVRVYEPEELFRLSG